MATVADALKTDTLKTSLKDGAYVAVGLGVIGFQQAQVRRRELQTQVEKGVAATRTQLRKLARGVEERAEPVVSRLQDRLPTSLPIPTSLPVSARDLVGQAYATVRQPQRQLRSLLGRA
jgi:hypothetical protein